MVLQPTYTVRSLMKLNATVTFRLPVRTVWLTAKLYKVLPIRVKYCSTKTMKLTYLFFLVVPAGSREVTVAFNFISERAVYIYIYIYICVCVCVYTHIYIYFLWKTLLSHPAHYDACLQISLSWFPKLNCFSSLHLHLQHQNNDCQLWNELNPKCSFMYVDKIDLL
jgi:hypothetical protein